MSITTIILMLKIVSAKITLSIISQKSICFESLAASTCTTNVNFPQEASQLKELVGVV